MSKKKKRARGHRKNEITKGIFHLLESNSSKKFNYKQIASQLGIRDTEGRNMLIKRLEQLNQKGRIRKVDRSRYQAIARTAYFTGVLDVSLRGNAYVITEELSKDILVPFNKLNKAFHGDTVEVYVYPKSRSGRIEGEVKKIIERRKTQFVGIMELHKSFGFVKPVDIRMYTDIFVPIENIAGAKTGEKVVVTLESWPDNRESPYGKIIEVLGEPGEHQTEIHAILAEYGLPHSFPDEVLQYANSLDTSIVDSEIKKRRDMRDVLTFTIDPADAKDFDDALSFKVLDENNYEVGIHIADVSHYVKPNTPLEDEAWERATSVYLVDRVVPMLPEVLSNDACSLRPKEDKYTFSAIFRINKNAKVLDRWFGRTVIHSNERFAYEEAQHVIENKTSEIPEEVSIRGGSYSIDKEVSDAILELNRLARIFRDRRMKSGAITFESIEVKFHLSEENEPTGVYFKESKEANNLIEEFMLLANREVAEYIGKQTPKKPFVYRIHDAPDEEKLIALNGIISKFGHSIDLRNRKTVNDSLNKLLERVKGRKEQNLVDTLAIRSMSKAVYSPDNIGHYGLAFEYYSHFTSPIRRYPDVMVHRLLQRYLDGGGPVKEKYLETACKHSSDMEYLATSAERDSIKYMQIKYMDKHRDKEFKGVISGVTQWGMYVEIIENKCEGMVRIRDIKDDYYTFDERKYALVGERKGKIYQLGDEVYVMVKDTDLIKRHLDFALVQNPISKKGSRTKK